MSNDEAETERILTSLLWKPFGPGKPGEWTFATTQQGELVAALANIRELYNILKETGGRIAVGSFEYSVKQDGKFLNRFSARSGQR